MDWLDALILGIVQGLAEYLPISSSGHLEIFKQVLGLELDPGQSLEFSVMLHVATVLSTIVVLWREFAPLCVSFFTFRRDARFYYVCKILLSCIPVAVVGLCFKDVVEELFKGNLTVVGICLLVTAGLLSFAYFFRTEPLESAKSSSVRKPYQPREISWVDAFVSVVRRQWPYCPASAVRVRRLPQESCWVTSVRKLPVSPSSWL